MFCAFPLFFFAFLYLLISTINVLSCACLQVCLWVFPVLVPVCCFLSPLFASFVWFNWGSNALFYTPFVLPSSPTSLTPLHQILCFGWVLFCSGVHLRPTMAHLWSALLLSRSLTLAYSPPNPSEPQNTKHIVTITTLTHSPMHVIFLLISTCCVCVFACMFAVLACVFRGVSPFYIHYP